MAGVVLALSVLALIGAGTWYFVLREPASNAPAKAASCPTGPPKPALPRPRMKPQQVSVNVYNATTRKGLAAATAAALRGRGFVIGSIANDPLNRKVAGVAEIRSGPKGRTRVPVVSLQVPSARSVVDKRTDASVDLVLGQRFVGLRTPRQIAALLAPPPKPAGC